MTCTQSQTNTVDSLLCVSFPLIPKNKVMKYKLTCRTESAPLKNLTVHSIIIVNKICRANSYFVTGGTICLVSE